MYIRIWSGIRLLPIRYGAPNGGHPYHRGLLANHLRMSEGGGYIDLQPIPIAFDHLDHLVTQWVAELDDISDLDHFFE